MVVFDIDNARRDLTCPEHIKTRLDRAYDHGIDCFVLSRLILTSIPTPLVPVITTSERFDLGNIARKFQVGFSTCFSDLGIEMVFEESDTPMPIAGDGFSAFRCLLNLGMNAKDAILKSHADKRLSSPGKITIKTWTNPEKTLASLSVTDNGCGYQSGPLPFTNSWHAQTHKERGHGMCVIGDTIEHLNGKIDCVSFTGKGTVFTVTLPLIPEPAAVVQAPLPLPLITSDRG